MNKKSQAWTLEFILGFLIFTAAIILSVKSIYNIYTNEQFSDLKKEGYIITDMFLSPGFPEDWTNNTVIRIGLEDNNSLSDRKLIELWNNTIYYTARHLANTHNDFYLTFEYNGTLTPLFYYVGATTEEVKGCGYGSLSVTATVNNNGPIGQTKCTININANYKDLAKITRVTSYNGSLIIMRLYLWK